jgi:hypothetical protein
MSKTAHRPAENDPSQRGRRLIVRSLVAGTLAALLVFALIQGLRPALFEDRADRVLEQCVKTGLSVFALSLLVSLAGSRKAGT